MGAPVKTCAADLSVLESLGERVVYTKDSEICRPGEIPTYCYYIKRGIVKAYEYDDEGKELVFGLWEAGALILAESLQLCMPARAAYAAQTDTALVRISLRGMEKMRRCVPELYLSLMRRADGNVGFMEQIRARQTKSPTQRLYEVLQLYARQFGVERNGACVIEERISLSRLAPLIGACTVTAARAMQELKAKNLAEYSDGYYLLHKTGSKGRGSYRAN